MPVRLLAAVALLLPLAGQNPKTAQSTQPVVIHKVEPKYSDEARQKKIQGTVTLNVIVSEVGKAMDIKVTKSLGAGLDESAIDAVKQWLFQPGTKDGKVVATIAIIEVPFRLK